MKSKEKEFQSKKGSKGNFFKSVVNGVGLSVGFSFGIILLLILAYAGWHPASQIISGVFKGNYTFAGNVKFNKQLQLPDVANVSCNSNTSGIIAYDSLQRRLYICVNSSWYNLNPSPTYIISLYNPNTENLTNFQVEVNISQVINNVGTNFEVDLSNGSKVNYCFVQQNGECKANYDNVNKIWVKVPLLPEKATVNLTVISSKANNALNGDKVFDFYDDFDENTLNKSKWGTIENTNYSLNDGYIKFWGDYSTKGIFSLKTFNLNKGLVVDWRGRVSTLSGDEDLYVGITPDESAFGEGNSLLTVEDVGWDSNDYDQRFIQYFNGGTITNYPNSHLNTLDWFYAKSTFTPSITYFWDSVNGGFNQSISLSWTSVYLSIGADTDSSSRFGYLDYVDVRKYAPLHVSVNVIQK